MTVLNVVSVSDINALDSQTDANIEVANEAVKTCASMSAADRTEWAGFYGAWKAVHKQWEVVGNPAWYNWSGIAGEMFFMGNIYSQMQDYTQEFETKRAPKLKAVCANYALPSSALSQTPTGKPKETPDDIDKYLTYAKTAGEVALIGAAAWGLYKIAGVLGDIRQTSKRLVG